MQLCKDITPQNSHKNDYVTKNISKYCNKDPISSANQNLGKSKQKPKKIQVFDLETNQQPVKIFVGGVPPKLSESYLRHLFKAEFSKIPEMKNKFRILSACCFKGFGFINITGLSKSRVEKALKDFSLVYNSRKFITRVAIDSNVSDETKLKKKDFKVLVRNLTDDITHVELNEYFSQFGKLDNTYAAFDAETGKHKGFGFVIFENFEDVKKVLEINKHEIKGKVVYVVENYLKEEWTLMKESGFSSKIARKKRKSENSSKISKHSLSSKSEITDNILKNSNESQSDPIKESKSDLDTKNDLENQSSDTLQFKVKSKKQIKKSNLSQNQIIGLSNDQNENTTNYEQYNYYPVSNNNFTPNAYYEIQDNNYNNKGYADPNTVIYNEYDYQNEAYKESVYQQYSQKDYYDYYNQNANYDQYPTNHCSNYDNNYSYHNYGQPQMYSNYNTVSGYENNNYDLSSQIYNAQNNELQHEQSQAFQNFQTHNFYRQDNMACNFNSSYQSGFNKSNANQNIQPRHYNEPSDQTNQNNTKDDSIKQKYNKNLK